MGTEIWKDIPGYEGKYQASSMGNIRSMNYKHSGKIKVMMPATDRCGYLHLGLVINRTRKNFFVSRLVGITFLEKLEHHTQINHKNGIKIDNCIENLEWCTNSENICHSYKKLGRKAISGKEHYLYGKPAKSRVKIGQYSLSGEFIKEWDSISEASLCLGISGNHISNCINGKRRKTGGFIWKRC